MADIASDLSKETTQTARIIMIIKKRYFTWCVILIIVTASAGTIAQDRPAADVKQNDLIAVLQSDAPKSDKAITCKQLAIYGTEQCRPRPCAVVGGQGAGVVGADRAGSDPWTGRRCRSAQRDGQVRGPAACRGDQFDWRAS